MNLPLFVYGSLRRNANHPMLETLQAGGTWLGPAHVCGRLYAISWYPGLVLDPTGGPVAGELWSNIDPTRWRRLDNYEGCGPEDAPPHEFVRTRAEVTRVGEQHTAWVYRFTGDIHNLVHVPSGDWLQHIATTRG